MHLRLRHLAFVTPIAVISCAPSPDEETMETVRSASTFVNNGSRTQFSWTAPISYPLTAIGRLNAPGLWCTGCLITPNKVLTAAHCLGDIPASSVAFTPHGSSTTAIGTRIVQGRDPSRSEIYGDWAIVTLNQSFPSQGTFAIVIPPAPPFTINDAGYSGDLPANTLGIHFNCPMTFDNGNGIGVNCDSQGGASGGPLYRWPGFGTARVYAVNAGHLGLVNAVYSNAVANTVAGAKHFAFAPDQTAGLAAAARGNGQLDVYSSDSDWNSVALRTESGSTPTGWTEWRAFDSQFTAGPRRLAAVNLQDGRQQVVVITSSGQMSTRWQTAVDGAWTGWGSLPGPAGTTVKDIAATGGSGIVTQLFALGANDNVYTSYKEGGSGSNWTAWCSLGNVAGAQALAAVRFGGVQQIFVASSTVGARTAWTSGQACAAWTAMQPFDGTGFRAISAGLLADGRVHVVAATTSGATQDRIRAADGSAWTSWTTFPSANPPITSGFVLLATGRFADGRELLLGVGTNGEVYAASETTAAAFTAWSRFYL